VEEDCAKENGFGSSDLVSLIGWGPKGFEGEDAKGKGLVVAGAEEGPPNRTELAAGGLPKVKPPKAALLPLLC